jgi:hypothetical protein
LNPLLICVKLKARARDENLHAPLRAANREPFMKALLAAILMASFWTATAAAGEDDTVVGTEAPKPRASVARQESLEMPGITACHQCEWRPKPHTKAAEEQCGMTPDGAPRQGLFECGFSPDCDRVCNFVRCAE